MQDNCNFIAGEWLAGASEIANINPSDLSDTIGMYAQADRTQLQRALEAANGAQKEWAKTGLEKRQRGPTDAKSRQCRIGDNRGW